jgi:hypothetical protein
MQKALNLYLKASDSYKDVQEMVTEMRKAGAKVYTSRGEFLDDLKFSLVESHSTLVVDTTSIEGNIQADLHFSIISEKENAAECKYCRNKTAMPVKTVAYDATLCTSCRAVDYDAATKKKLQGTDRLKSVNSSKISLKVSQPTV